MTKSCRKHRDTDLRKKMHLLRYPRADNGGWRCWLAGGQQYLALGSVTVRRCKGAIDLFSGQKAPQEWQGGVWTITSMVTNMLVQSSARLRGLFLTQESIFRRTCSQAPQ